MTESKSPTRAGIKCVPRPAVIDPNQRYSLAETHAALAQSYVKTFQDIKRGMLQTIKDGRRVDRASRLDSPSSGKPPQWPSRRRPFFR